MIHESSTHQADQTVTPSKGFTLLEVLVALIVFTVGILAVFSLQVTSIRGNHTAYQFFEGTNQGADTLETMAGQPYTHGDFTAGSHGPIFNGPNNSFRTEWTVTDNSDNTKTIVMTVQWSQPGGTTRTVTYQFIKGRDV